MYLWMDVLLPIAEINTGKEQNTGIVFKERLR